MPDPTMAGLVSLMTAGEFREAARVALALAMQHRRMQFRTEWLETLAIAAKCHALAGDHDAAIRQFEEVFQIEDDELGRLPSPDLVIARLVHWPERYARAAIAAVDANRLMDAIRLAETGRFRVLGQNLGPSVERPTSVPPESWARYLSVWRRLAAAAAGRVAAAGPTDPRTREWKACLSAVRKELRKAGVPVESMRRPADDFDPEVGLRQLTDETVVLYSIVLDEQVRFLSVSAGHAREARITRDEQAALLQSCRRHRSSFASARTPTDLRNHIEALVASTAATVEKVLQAALDGLRPGRLLWIGHGVLSTLPLAAYRFGDDALIASVALMTSPSLRFATSSEVVAAAGARAARGSPDGRTETAGGGSLVRQYDSTAPAEGEPTDADELFELARQAPLLHLTCHGEYDWQDPLRTSLVLAAGHRATLEQIIDHGKLREDQLILLGACDAGTALQGENNEAIGVPTALMLSGCRTVIGAQWPVTRIAAVGLSLQILTSLRDGTPTPEAVQRATLWLRSQNAATFAEALALIDHPLAPFISRMGRRFTITVHDWAAFVHWGASWRLDEAVSDGGGSPTGQP